MTIAEWVDGNSILWILLLNIILKKNHCIFTICLCQKDKICESTTRVCRICRLTLIYFHSCILPECIHIICTGNNMWFYIVSFYQNIKRSFKIYLICCMKKKMTHFSICRHLVEILRNWVMVWHWQNRIWGASLSSAY